MNVHTPPIGIFDSGLGGLSVAIEIEKALPNEQLLYAADSRFCPYGSRSEEEIRWRSLLIANALVERGAKLLVIACNTATAFALEALRTHFSVPIIGLEPALKPAVAMSRCGKVGVLATPRTASSTRLQRLIDRYGAETLVFVVPAPGFVQLVEEFSTDCNEIDRLVSNTVAPLIDGKVDSVVLGCTHYPFLRGAIQRAMGSDVTLVDSGAAIARRIATVLGAVNDLAGTEIPGSLEMLTTGDADSVAPVAAKLLGREVSVRSLDLPIEPPQSGYDASLPPKLSAAWTSSVSAVA